MKGGRPHFFMGDIVGFLFYLVLELILVLFFVTLLLSSLCLQRAFKRMWGKNLHCVVVRLSKIVIYDNIVTMTILSLYCRDNIVTIYDNKTIGFFNLRKKYFSKQKMLAT